MEVAFDEVAVAVGRGEDAAAAARFDAERLAGLEADVGGDAGVALLALGVAGVDDDVGVGAVGARLPDGAAYYAAT